MKSKITYKTRVKILYGAMPIILFLCYKLSFSGLSSEFNKHRELSNLVKNTGNSAVLYDSLRLRVVELKAFLKKYTIESGAAGDSSLDLIARYCAKYSLKVIEFKPHSAGVFKDQIKLSTKSVVVQGSFIDCLKLVYELEQKSEVGRVASIFFKTIHDNKTDREYLTCIIYLQTILK